MGNYEPARPGCIILIAPILLLIVILSSCCTFKSGVSKYECKKARAEKKIAKLVRQYPDLIVTDTATVIDTLITEHVRTDTLFRLGENDTIVIEKDRFRVKIMRSVDTFLLEGECLPDTIVRTVRVPYDRIVVKDCPKCLIKKATAIWIGLILLAVIIAGIVLRAFRVI